MSASHTNSIRYIYCARVWEKWLWHLVTWLGSSGPFCLVPVINLYKERFVFVFLSVSSDTTICYFILEAREPYASSVWTEPFDLEFLILVCWSRLRTSHIFRWLIEQIWIRFPTSICQMFTAPRRGSRPLYQYTWDAPSSYIQGDGSGLHLRSRYPTWEDAN